MAFALQLAPPGVWPWLPYRRGKLFRTVQRDCSVRFLAGPLLGRLLGRVAGLSGRVDPFHLTDSACQW
jgi:hypothetical protein